MKARIEPADERVLANELPVDISSDERLQVNDLVRGEQIVLAFAVWAASLMSARERPAWRTPLTLPWALFLVLMLAAGQGFERWAITS